MKQRTMLYLFTLSAVMVSATVYAGETKPEIQIAAESTTGSLKDMELNDNQIVLLFDSDVHGGISK